MAQTKLYAGIDLGGTGIKYGLADSGGKIIVSRRMQSPVSDGADAVMDAIIQAGAEMIEYAGKHSSFVPTVGIGSPGGIDSQKGIVLGTTPNIPDWNGMKIKARAERALKSPCFVDNDANLFLLAEHQFGAANGFRHAVGFTIGTGIGGALLINNEIYRGSQSVGAEMGHSPIVANGRLCKCGLRGCLEAYASASNLVKFYNTTCAKKDKVKSSRIVFNRAKDGNKIAEKAVDKWCGYLATGIAATVNTLNPEVVILGGGISHSGNYLRKKIETMVFDKSLPLTRDKLKIKLAKLGNKAGWLGASALARMGN